MGTFQPIIVRLDETLELAGDTTCLADHIDVDSYTLGEQEFRLPDGVDYDLVLTNAGEGILVTGMLRAHVVGECDRCLEPAEFDVAGEVDEYYLFHEPETEPDDDDEEEGVDYSLVSDEHTIDVAEALTSALLMETPFVILCREDCKGLCPTCGANLNEGDCGCAEKRAQQALDESPFAALKNLDLGDR